MSNYLAAANELNILRGGTQRRAKKLSSNFIQWSISIIQNTFSSWPSHQSQKVDSFGATLATKMSKVEKTRNQKEQPIRPHLHWNSDTAYHFTVSGGSSMINSTHTCHFIALPHTIMVIIIIYNWTELTQCASIDRCHGSGCKCCQHSDVIKLCIISMQF